MDMVDFHIPGHILCNIPVHETFILKDTDIKYPLYGV